MAYYNNRYNNSRRNNNFNRRRNWNNRRITFKQQRRRRSVPPTRRAANKSTTIGSFMKTAVSSIISALPGSTILKSVADFVFKAVKVKESVEDFQIVNSKDDPPTPPKYLTIGLNQIIVLTRAHFISNSPEIKVINGDPTQKGILKHNHFEDVYHLHNIKEVNIEIRPQNDVGSRQGQWAMVFIPFLSTQHEQDLRADYTNSYVGYNDILKMEGAVSGQQTQSIRIRYAPQAHDGRAYLPGKSEDKYGLLLIAYQDFAKAPESDFSPQDFAATLLLNSVVRKVNRRARVFTLVPLNYESILSDVEEFIYQDNRVYVVTSTPIDETTSLNNDVRRMAVE